MCDFCDCNERPRDYNDPSYLRMIDGVGSMGAVVMATGVGALVGGLVGSTIESQSSDHNEAQVGVEELPATSSIENQGLNQYATEGLAIGAAILIGGIGLAIRRRFLRNQYS